MFIKGYSDFSLSKAGVMSSANWGVHFKLDTDVRQLFPYINASFQDTRFHDKPEYIQFAMDGFQCSLYPDEVIATSFTGQDQALEFVKRLIDFLNDLYIRKDKLKPNYKKFRPISVIDIYKLLPQTNCKECGFPTCMAFAASLSQGQANTDQCPGFISPIYENAVYPVYDKDGNLSSTVAIEIDITKKIHESNEQEKYIESLEKKLAEEKKRNKAALENGENKVQTNLIQTAKLTEREIQVLRLVAEGATNGEISEMLSISPHTVKSHVVHIFNKLGVNDRTQAAVWATRHKII